ncbi:MAG TPA: hypothetical protein VHZ99_11865 [Steroidobacteraceae bacterium]|nr:hypothetical protein [Steroidobacteraceae bacterium]
MSSNSFGLKGALPADGLVDAMPLIVSKLTIGGAAHDVVYVATENDTVYAYDIDSLNLIKQVSLLGSGETAASAFSGCNQVSPKIGITSTPVIDRSAGANGTLFVVAMSQNAGGTVVYRLHALDLVDLHDLMTPVSIAASVAGSGANASNGTLTFNPRQYKERSGLLLSGGQIYTAWASNCDVPPYNSWIMAYDESTLAQTRVINLTPHGTQGAIWSAGGMLDDGAGSLYTVLGNGTYDSQQDYGNAAVRLDTGGNTLTVADYFTPTNSVAESAADTDFGSGSPMLLPAQTDTSGTAHQLMFAAGKDGNMYLLDRTNLGSFNASVNQVYQMVSGQIGGMFSAPAYFNGTLYVGSVGRSLQAFSLTAAKLPASATSHTTATFNYPGTTPSVSANGSSNGIVWTVESSTTSPAVLHAYNPTNLAQEYYNSTQAGSRDSFGNGNKFVTPVIADGHVYIGTSDSVAVFGLL